MPYFGEPVGRVKIQTSKNSQRYCTTKRLIRDLLSNTSKFFVCVGEFRGYLRGMCGRSIRSGTKLARGIQLTDWSTANKSSNRSSGVQIPRDICTRLGRYLYSTRCSWIIKGIIPLELEKKNSVGSGAQIHISSCLKQGKCRGGGRGT